MAVLRWKHSTTAAGAADALREELEAAGHAGRVRWEGNRFSASVGFGVALGVRGEVGGEEVVLEKCGGAMGGAFLAAARRILSRRFPGGEVS